MRQAKLTEEELRLLQDATLMPAKFRIWEKIEHILLQLQQQLAATLDTEGNFLPGEIRNNPHKLSRGENYRQNPYRVLDYPKSMSGKDLFTFRTLVLWGDAIGFHLILSGKYREMFLPCIRQRATCLPGGWYLSAQQTPWIWEREAAHLYPCGELDTAQLAALLEKRSFVKFSRFLPLAQYDAIAEQGLLCWHNCLQLLNGPGP